MEADRARRDLDLIRRVLDRSRRCVDPHAFHFVHWGAIVLAWFPISNLLVREGRFDLANVTGAASLLLGFALSWMRESRLKTAPRIAGEDEVFSRQVIRAVWGPLAAAGFVSAFGPATGFIEGPHVPVIWGIAYAAIAFMMGILYTPEFHWSGMAIFGGCLAAMAFPEWNGVILGPFMGLGLIVPGAMAERRVRRAAAEGAGDGLLAG
jgi:hypothetical protein